jgi:hypothetical protein
MGTIRASGLTPEIEAHISRVVVHAFGAPEGLEVFEQLSPAHQRRFEHRHPDAATVAVMRRLLPCQTAGRVSASRTRERRPGRPRRAGASSTTSGSDPGDGDPDTEPLSARVETEVRAVLRREAARIAAEVTA